MTIIVDMKDPEKIIGFVKRNWAHIVGWGLLALLYYPILRQLYTARWKNIDYEHAYFILPISIFLVWRLRKELAGVYSAAKEKISYLFLSIFVLGIAMYVFGWKWDYLFICAISLIPVSFAMTGFIYGWEVVKKIWFSFFYLIFMVPPPAAVLDNLTLPMRYISSHIAYGILKVAGYA
ncbi:MAG TPA: exosortase/archaeosortase family protein, partial [Candidatus Omnitrophota bacterium]|nr:exosortase/archaeosortase family protein [Candidatus Omnitrophota bacterium]